MKTRIEDDTAVLQLTVDVEIEREFRAYAVRRRITVSELFTRVWGQYTRAERIQTAIIAALAEEESRND